MERSIALGSSAARSKGIMMVVMGASLWGISGTAAQPLFQQEGFAPGWLTTVRLLIAGLFFLVASLFQYNRRNVLTLWQEPGTWWRMILFGILGMMGVQYTYFAAIHTGNAAVATLLQYLGPLFITMYVALRAWRLPSQREMISVAIALIGTFLLVTNGSLQGLSVPLDAVGWGIASAVALAFYTLYPVELLKRWGTTVIVGWAMVIGGVVLALIYPPWEVAGQHWTFANGLSIVFVIIFGTIVPFFFYLESLRYVTPVETSLLACVEPLTAVIVSYLWLQLPLRFFEIVGGLCIVATVTTLSLMKSKPIGEK